MPIHDWTRVDAGIFHAFHHNWLTAISNELNAGLLPADYYALPEQVAIRARTAERIVPDVLTLHRGEPSNGAVGGPAPSTGAVGLLVAPPKATTVVETDLTAYRRKQTVLAVRHVSGDRVVAVAEVVSPGNKSSAQSFRDFVEKAAGLVDRGVHLLVVDLLPPTARDPDGIHGAVWDFIEGEPYRRPADKPLTVVSYAARDLGPTGYVEPLAVGDRLPDAPLYLTTGGYVKVPLEATYQTTWGVFPARWRDVVAPPG